jgi:predicted naringenin-chalcone synthase
MLQSATSFVLSLGKAVPKHANSQYDLATWMLNHEGIDDPKTIKFIRQLYQLTNIEKRYSVLPDFTVSFEPILFEPNTPEPNVAARMHAYYEHVMPLALEASHEAINKAHQDHDIQKQDITHIISVSCTGLQAPGIDIILLEELGLNPHTARTSVNFMGCYAALHALKQAWYISRAEPEAVVLIVCVELCTLHYRKGTERETLASQALFADGAAAAIVSQRAKSGSSALKIIDFGSSLISAGKEAMSWKIDALGFLMHLDSSIPAFLLAQLKEELGTFSNKNQISLSDCSHAVHPGGKKILEAYSKSLSLEPDELAASHEVLKNYGNMSSPTILFVLAQIWNSATSKPILTSAFGPGLTVEMALFQNVLG